MKIGIGVEGPSDWTFHRQVLRNHFPHCEFDVRAMKGKPNLIKRASDLLNNFRNAHYQAGIILLDADRDPCVTAIRSKFAEDCMSEFMLARDRRFFHLVVVKKNLESWLMADSEAVRQTSGVLSYDAPPETSSANLERILKPLYGDISKIALAGKMSATFDPNRGSANSESLAYYTNLLKKLTQAGLRA